MLLSASKPVILFPQCLWLSYDWLTHLQIVTKYFLNQCLVVVWSKKEDLQRSNQAHLMVIRRHMCLFFFCKVSDCVGKPKKTSIFVCGFISTLAKYSSLAWTVNFFSLCLKYTTERWKLQMTLAIFIAIEIRSRNLTHFLMFDTSPLTFQTSNTVGSVQRVHPCTQTGQLH